MKVEQVPCGECGILIPEVTAQRTKGLCIPCKMKLTKADPVQELFKSLSERIYRFPNGFVSLSEPEKLFYALTLLREEFQKGGVQRYFADPSGSYYEYAEKGLSALGTKRLLEVLQQAKEFIFPDMSVPTDTEQRRQILSTPRPNVTTAEWSEKLAEFDRAFRAASRDLSARLKVFAHQHALISEHDMADD